MIRSVLTAYEEKVGSGELVADPAQEAAARALARLEGELNALAEPSLGLGFLRRREPPRGVYLFGPVGRGKSMLMDLFFASAPAPRKRRVHFHAFMTEVHGLVNAWRTGDGASRRQRFGQHRGDDPIAPVAGVIADGARLLCFDELQVVDIADAMILGRLFEALFARGVVVVATSNRAPDDLYKDGLNRQLFLPFIALFKARLEVVEVAGPRDFRADRLRGEAVSFSPDDEAAAAAFDRLWRGLIGAGPETEARIDVLGRTLVFPRAAGPCVRVRFEALCGEALGPADYLALAARFSTVFLEGAPVLTPDRRNEAARFIALIDALYEARALLVLLAAAEPRGLYPEGDGAFEFARTASRLEEMRSKDWVEARAGAATGPS
jgi:cell division protein ZapE